MNKTMETVRSLYKVFLASVVGISAVVLLIAAAENKNVVELILAMVNLLAMVELICDEEK